MRAPVTAMAALVVAACSAATAPPSPTADGQEERTDLLETGPARREPVGPMEVATFGAGCFWCAEAVLEQLPGVSDVTAGFMGGTVEDPTYEQVSTGTTGHAEVVRVAFDPKKIRYEELLDWFWRLHDPTTPNRQGADVGTQYRSVVFWHTDAQRAAAEAAKNEAQASFADPIVTEIAKAGTFHPAGDAHQDYYRLNRTQGYCRAVIAPKLTKLGLKE